MTNLELDEVLDVRPNIVEIFDPNQSDWVWGYLYLESNGRWPEGFLPPNVVFPPGWQKSLSSKLEKCMLRGDAMSKPSKRLVCVDLEIDDELYNRLVRMANDMGVYVSDLIVESLRCVLDLGTDDED